MSNIPRYRLIHVERHMQISEEGDIAPRFGKQVRFRLFACAFLGALAVAVAELPSTACADTIGDPLGDTFGAGPDITSISTSLSGANQDTLQIAVGFGGPIFAPSSFNLNSLGGWIAFDTNGDANIASALSFLTTNLSPASGIDFSIDLFSEEFQPGKATLLNSGLSTIGLVPISFGATSFSVNVPVSSLGTANPGIGVVVGTFNTASDLAFIANATITTPEPPSMTLFVFLAGMAASAWRMQRRVV